MGVAMVLAGCGHHVGVASAACWNQVAATGDEWVGLGGDAAADPRAGALLSLKGAPDGRIKVVLGEKRKIHGVVERQGVRLFVRRVLPMAEGLVALPGAEVLVSRISGRRVRATAGRISKWIDCGQLTPTPVASQTESPRGDRFLRGDSLVTSDVDGRDGLLYVAGGEDVRVAIRETKQDRVAIEGIFRRIQFRGWVDADAVTEEPSGLPAAQAAGAWGPVVRCGDNRDAVTTHETSVYGRHGSDGVAPAGSAVVVLPGATPVLVLTLVGDWRLVVVSDFDPSIEHLVGWVRQDDLDRPTCGSAAPGP